VSLTSRLFPKREEKALGESAGGLSSSATSPEGATTSTQS
jgi:hypothetical protein